MLSLKQRRLALIFVQDPSATFIEIAQQMKVKGLKKATPNWVSKNLRLEEVNEYVEQLQGDVKRAMNLSQKKQIKKLKKIAKAGMKTKIDANGNVVPVNLAASTSALCTINSMTGLDKEQKAKIKINTDKIDHKDPAYAEKLLTQIMGQFMDRTLDKEDLEALMKSLDTLATYRLNSKVEAKLNEMGIVDTGSIFDEPKDQIT